MKYDKTIKYVRLSNELIGKIQEFAEKEHRTFVNALEVIVLNYLANLENSLQK
jgi:hypothetical protein